MSVQVRYAFGSCWLVALRGREWANASSSSLRWKDGQWFHGGQDQSPVEDRVTPAQAAVIVVGSFLGIESEGMDVGSLVEKLSPGSMREISLALEVMDS